MTTPVPSAEQLRIAVVGVRGIPGNYSGIESAVNELSPRLVDKGHKVTVFCMKSRYDRRPATHLGARLVYLPGVRSKHFEMFVHAGLGSMATLVDDYDVVHFHACGPALFAILPRMAGRASVCTLHGLDWQAPKWKSMAKNALKAGEWSACKLASRTIAVSRTQQEYLQAKYGTEVDFIPNGLPHAHHRKAGEFCEKHDLEHGEFILFVGRMTPGKNVHHLIEAFKAVDTKKKLVIAGGFSYTDSYERQIRALANNDPRIVFTGPVYGEELQELFSNAFLLVLPSLHEGMPIVVLESFAYAVPVLVSDIPENLDVVADSGRVFGLTFAVGSVEALADKLRYALRSPELMRAYADAGKKMAERRFSWDSIADRTIGVYREALSMRKGLRPEHRGEI